MNERSTYDKVWDILDYLKKTCFKNSAFSRREKEKTHNLISLDNFDSTITAMNNLRQAFLEFIEAGAHRKDSDLIIRALNLLESDEKYNNFRDKICMKENTQVFRL